MYTSELNDDWSSTHDRSGVELHAQELSPSTSTQGRPEGPRRGGEVGSSWIRTLDTERPLDLERCLIAPCFYAAGVRERLLSVLRSCTAGVRKRLLPPAVMTEDEPARKRLREDEIDTRESTGDNEEMDQTAYFSLLSLTKRKEPQVFPLYSSQFSLTAAYERMETPSLHIKWELFIAVVILLLVHWLIKRRDHFKFFEKLGIPGPTPNIFLGNVFEMYRKSPARAYREWIQKYGDTVGYFNGHRPVILTADLNLLRQIQIKDFHDFTDRGLLFQAKRPPSPQNKSLFQLTSNRWKEVRSVLTPSFTTNKLRLMSPGVISAVEKLVFKIDRKAKTGEEFEAGEMYAALALDVICKSAMGIDYNLQEHPRHRFLVCCRLLFGCAFSIIAVLLAAFPGSAALLQFVNFRLLRFQNNGVHPFAEVQEKCKRIVTERQLDSSLRRKDLLQLMIDAKDSRVDAGSVTSTQLTAAEDNDEELPSEAKSEISNGKLPGVFNKAVLDDDDITQNAFAILVAGFETTSNTMSLVTHMLMHHPQVQEKVRKELLSVLDDDEPITYSTIQKLPYLNCVILETMRLYPPAFAFVTREAVRDKQYEKFRIPAGTVVMAAVEYIHRDARHWEHPDRFDPDRFLPENKSRINTMAMQAFGNGPRNCIGMRFAHMELRYTFAHILRKYRLQKTENSEKDPPSIEMNPIILKIKNGVKVKAVPL
ncbi:thromboxane-A synthase-like [Dermacentor variabilis]|uniref:thromboxane-A synthase-like n=1 Tax=Dermacentor variabilis TaxID=34621 RepID=UPI003F5B5A66